MSENFLIGDRNLTPADASVALIMIEDDRYLMQLRNQKPGIFYPGHWGLFGGALDAGENFDMALARELKEELGIDIERSSYFTEFTFDFSFCDHGKVSRRYFIVRLSPEQLNSLVLGEGSAMKAFSAQELLRYERVVPYDAFAIWLHTTRRQK